MKNAWRAVVRVRVLALLFSATVSCAPAAEDARTYFASGETCPRDRVRVNDGPELTSRELAVRDEPPAYLGDDPERVEMWASQRIRTWDARGSTKVYEVHGCYTHAEIACYRRGFGTKCKTLTSEHHAPPNPEVERIKAEVDRMRREVCATVDGIAGCPEP
jgi:hypothetical protein